MPEEDPIRTGTALAGERTPPLLLWLFFRPRRFFARFVAEPHPGLTVFACFLFGIVSACERLEDRLQLSGRAAPGIEFIRQSLIWK